MAEPSNVNLLNQHGWQEEDAAWERLQQEVSTALGANDLQLARRQIGQASALAKTHFQTGDPRLAATLACQGWLLEDGTSSLASSLFQEALAHWNQAAAWLARQPPPERLVRPERLERPELLARPVRLARSSSFHLRLESKHPGAYRDRLREDMSPLLTLGHALTECLRTRRPSVTTGCDQALSTAALPFDSHRKVKTAVSLLRDCSS